MNFINSITLRTQFRAKSLSWEKATKQSIALIEQVAN